VDVAAETRFREFVALHGPGLQRLARVLTATGADGEDLVQTVLASVYVSWGRVQNVEEPVAYVRRMLINAAADGHRRRRRRPELLQAVPADGADHRDRLRQVDERELVRSWLARLPARQRAVVVLRFLDDVSEQDTAAALGISVGAVKSHTSRALHRLRELAEDERHEEGTLSHARQR